MKKDNIIKILVILTKIFFIGLLLQFFLQTFVNFWLWRSWKTRDIIRLWKEIIILILFIFSLYRIRKHKIWKVLSQKIHIGRLIVLLIILWFFVLLNGLLITQTWLTATIFSLRYSITWFIIFIIFSFLSFAFLEKKPHLEMWYNKIIKRLLWGSLFRWIIIFFVPRMLEFVWYNQYNYEWDINIAPPAAYYSQYNSGYVRNQFLFERPISWGFFLVAFWPMFFALAIKKRWWKAVLFGGWLYWLAVLSTFSRAAWWAWFAQVLIIFLIEYRKSLKKAFLYGFIPILLVFWSITYFWRDQIINRKFSNTWHFTNIVAAIEKIKEKPLFGDWPWTAWPASHHLWEDKEYNPENQFLQIRIEYGILGFIFWMIIYLWFIWIWYKTLRISIHKKSSKQEKYFWYLLFSLSLGIFWLSICWLVLHSFVDRMIVYPFMAMFGIIYGQYQYIRSEKNRK